MALFLTSCDHGHFNIQGYCLALIISIIINMQLLPLPSAYSQI